MAFHHQKSACFTMLIIIVMTMMMISSHSSAARPYDDKKTVPCWCVALATASKSQLQEGIDYACAHTDCRHIQPGGQCFEPDNVLYHASFAYNHYILDELKPADCYFNGTAGIDVKDPSYGSCHYSNFLCTPPS